MTPDYNAVEPGLVDVKGLALGVVLRIRGLGCSTTQPLDAPLAPNEFLQGAVVLAVHMLGGLRHGRGPGEGVDHCCQDAAIVGLLAASL